MLFLFLCHTFSNEHRFATKKLSDEINTTKMSKYHG